MDKRLNITLSISHSCRFELVQPNYSFWYEGKNYQKISDPFSKTSGFELGWALDTESNKKLFNNKTWVGGICYSTNL